MIMINNDDLLRLPDVYNAESDVTADNPFATTTCASIIVTVDSTGYTGPVTIGAMELATLTVVNTSTVNTQNCNVLNSNPTGAPTYNATFTLDQGKPYLLYAFATAPTEKAGGCFSHTFTQDNETINVIIHNEILES